MEESKIGMAIPEINVKITYECISTGQKAMLVQVV